MIENGNAETWPADNSFENTNWSCNNCIIEQSPKPKNGNGAFRIKERQANWAGLNYNLGVLDSSAKHEFSVWVKVLSPKTKRVFISTTFVGNDDEEQFVRQ